ncbi:hypothetical protein HZH68_010176 [Vespula germanica]|uniref:Uncharacterized protein n=1 Tax=Vespula germanica TaxID=30212 RepID=A0A834JTQ9_VESGE|nr:hypothetical protein HZH68_010176 [Vespula germanica]
MLLIVIYNAMLRIDYLLENSTDHTKPQLFEKLFLCKLKSAINNHKLITQHQFGFQQQHAISEQIHRLANKITKHLMTKNIALQHSWTYYRLSTKSGTSVYNQD